MRTEMNLHEALLYVQEHPTKIVVQNRTNIVRKGLSYNRSSRRWKQHWLDTNTLTHSDTKAFNVASDDLNYTWSVWNKDEHLNINVNLKLAQWKQLIEELNGTPYDMENPDENCLSEIYKELKRQTK